MGELRFPLICWEASPASHPHSDDDNKRRSRLEEIKSFFKREKVHSSDLWVERKVKVKQFFGRTAAPVSN